VDELNFPDFKRDRKMVQNNNLNLHLFSRELRLLIALLKLENNKYYFSETSELLVDVDWKKFIQLAKHHRVYPMVYENILRKSINVPDFVMDTLNNLCFKNTMNMLTLTAEIETVCKTLASNNIQTLVLKGPILADYLYGDISKRTSKDLDILVPITKIEKVEELLYSLGYQLEYQGSRILNDWKQKVNHLSFYHPKRHIQVEVHVYLNRTMGLEPKFNDLWIRKNTSYLTGTPIYFLGIEDLFFHLVTHGARHAWFRLRWLVDIDKILKKEINYMKLLELLEKYEANRSYAQAIDLCDNLLDSKVGEKLHNLIRYDKHQLKLTQIAIYFINNSISPHAKEKSGKFYKKYSKSLRTKKQRLLLIMKLMYPSSSDAKVFPLPKPLHFLYFPLRPFIWSYRRIRMRRGNS